MLKKWDDLPDFMRVSEVRPYYDVLSKRRGYLIAKRVFDLCAALVILILLAIPMAVIAVWIKLDSPGNVFYRQERATAYGRPFRIHKFRTMVSNADRIGNVLTVGGDSRITRCGSRLRRLRLDELPQLFDVLEGTMSFVGTRPEVFKYVNQYPPEYRATLLMPAGITSEASIRFKDEDRILEAADDVDRAYMEEVLPEKMKWNLKSIKDFSIWADLGTMFKTVAAVLGKDYA